MTGRRLTEIRARREKITPAPWFAASREYDDDSWWIWAESGDEDRAPTPLAVVAYEGFADGATTEEALAEFIAAAPADVSFLLAEVERQQRRLDLVLSLHREIPKGDPMGNSGFCTGCDYGYPCPTIRALQVSDDVAAAALASTEGTTE